MLTKVQFYQTIQPQLKKAYS